MPPKTRLRALSYLKIGDMLGNRFIPIVQKILLGRYKPLLGPELYIGDNIKESYNTRVSDMIRLDE
jgi:hypothetical protein